MLPVVPRPQPPSFISLPPLKTTGRAILQREAGSKTVSQRPPEVLPRTKLIATDSHALPSDPSDTTDGSVFTPRAFYLAACTAYEATPNRHITSSLPDRPNSWEHLTSISISIAGYIGHRGFLPFLELVRHAAHLRSLSVAGCDCDDLVTEWIVASLLPHKHFHYLDMRGCPRLTDAAARCLHFLAVHSPALRDVKFNHDANRLLGAAIELVLRTRRAGPDARPLWEERREQKEEERHRASVREGGEGTVSGLLPPVPAKALIGAAPGDAGGAVGAATAAAGTAAGGGRRDSLDALVVGPSSDTQGALSQVSAVVGVAPYDRVSTAKARARTPTRTRTSSRGAGRGGRGRCLSRGGAGGSRPGTAGISAESVRSALKNEEEVAVSGAVSLVSQLGAAGLAFARSSDTAVREVQAAAEAFLEGAREAEEEEAADYDETLMAAAAAAPSFERVIYAKYRDRQAVRGSRVALLRGRVQAAAAVAVDAVDGAAETWTHAITGLFGGQNGGLAYAISQRAREHYLYQAFQIRDAAVQKMRDLQATVQERASSIANADTSLLVDAMVGGPSAASANPGDVTQGDWFEQSDLAYSRALGGVGREGGGEADEGRDGERDAIAGAAFFDVAEVGTDWGARAAIRRQLLRAETGRLLDTLYAAVGHAMAAVRALADESVQALAEAHLGRYVSNEPGAWMFVVDRVIHEALSVASKQCDECLHAVHAAESAAANALGADVADATSALETLSSDREATAIDVEMVDLEAEARHTLRKEGCEAAVKVAEEATAALSERLSDETATWQCVLQMVLTTWFQVPPQASLVILETFELVSDKYSAFCAHLVSSANALGTVVRDSGSLSFKDRAHIIRAYETRARASRASCVAAIHGAKDGVADSISACLFESAQREEDIVSDPMLTALFQAAVLTQHQLLANAIGQCEATEAQLLREEEAEVLACAKGLFPPTVLATRIKALHARAEAVRTGMVVEARAALSGVSARTFLWGSLRSSLNFTERAEPLKHVADAIADGYSSIVDTVEVYAERLREAPSFVRWTRESLDSAAALVGAWNQVALARAEAVAAASNAAQEERASAISNIGFAWDVAGLLPPAPPHEPGICPEGHRCVQVPALPTVDSVYTCSNCAIPHSATLDGGALRCATCDAVVCFACHTSSGDGYAVWSGAGSVVPPLTDTVAEATAGAVTVAGAMSVMNGAASVAGGAPSTVGMEAEGSSATLYGGLRLGSGDSVNFSVVP